MKNIKIALLLLIMTLSCGNIFAEEENKADALIDAGNIPYERTPVNKLGRGMINLFTCLAEVPAEAYKVTQEKDALTGCTLGVVEGFGTAFLRGLTGLVDAVTFLFPPYDKPLMTPEYAYTDVMNKFKLHKKVEHGYDRNENIVQ